ncbi:hypothetical protein [Streptomyces sp. NPDC048157]|uniref:hypothetical protein n=1 Tax=Streptomyces sp. NPDC048157 TaxID=3365503 RepID=UPI00371819FD
MTTRISSPNSCRHCGLDEREHMQRWKPTASWHTWTPPTQDKILARMRARRAAPEGELTMPDTLAHEVTVDCFDVQLDNGENLKDLAVGDYLDLTEPAAGVQVGLWQVVAYHGEFQDRATMRPVSSTEWTELRRAEVEKFDAIWAPTAPVKEV